MSEHLKCDAADCDHIEQVGTITESHVDMPCPKCGANLLTREDWEAWRPIQAAMGWVESLDQPEGNGGPLVAMKVGLHGPKMSIEIDRLKGTDNG